jgi:hypothetical protein
VVDSDCIAAYRSKVGVGKVTVVLDTVQSHEIFGTITTSSGHDNGGSVEAHSLIASASGTGPSFMNLGSTGECLGCGSCSKSSENEDR